jgi:hypothetical protein
VQDEGEDRYLIFGNLYSVVASFSSNSYEMPGTALSGRISNFEIQPKLMFAMDTCSSQESQGAVQDICKNFLSLTTDFGYDILEIH